MSSNRCSIVVDIFTAILLHLLLSLQCILFNDVLVFAMGDSKQSIVELQIPLEALWVEDLEDRDPQTR